MCNPETQQQRHPDLEGYVSKRRINPNKWYLPKWMPTSQQDVTRMKINSKLWLVFSGRVQAQKVAGGSAAFFGFCMIACWVDGIAPYFALSEDPNTAFKHPHWVKVANERTKRELEMRKRAESSGSGFSSSVALEHATKSYSAQNAGERLG